MQGAGCSTPGVQPGGHLSAIWYPCGGMDTRVAASIIVGPVRPAEGPSLLAKAPVQVPAAVPRCAAQRAGVVAHALLHIEVTGRVGRHAPDNVFQPLAHLGVCCAVLPSSTTSDGQKVVVNTRPSPRCALCMAAHSTCTPQARAWWMLARSGMS